MSKAMLAVVLPMILALPLAGCREAEQGRTLDFNKGVYQGQADESDTVRHQGQLVWRAGAAINHPSGDAPRVLFQLVPEAKSVKNRVHLDVRVGPDQVAAEVERLTGRGATLLHHGQQGPFRWVTLADPEGNELCIT